MAHNLGETKAEITFVSSIHEALCQFMGLRRGEVVALKWEDIDFKNYTLSVNKSAYKEKGKPQALKVPKSQNSVRTVYFSQIYAQALLDWQAE